MSFLIKYSRFIHVVFLNDDTGQPIDGFYFSPTRICRQNLSNYNLAFRPRSSGFEIFYSETPLISIAQRVRFSFGFTIAGSGFFEKYGLNETGESDTEVYQPGLYFDNLNADGSIITGSPGTDEVFGISEGDFAASADTYKINRPTFNVFDSNEETPPGSYELSHRYDASLTQTTPVQSKPDANYLVTTINAIDREEEYLNESGPYLLHADTGLPPDRNIYLHEDLGQNAVHGVVDIYWETAQTSISDSEKGQEYQITFKPT